MTARDILAREAEAIILESGAVEARADHFGPWWRVYGRLASGDEHVGTTHLQADPQDPRDLARRLVVIMNRMRAEPEAVAASAEAVQALPVQEGADHDAPINTDGEPAAAAGTGGDSDEGEREMGDGPAANDVPLGDAGLGAAGDAAADGRDVGSELGESGVVVRFALSAGDLAGIEDAEFNEFEHDSHAVEVDDDDIPEMILIENDPNDIPVEEPVYAGPLDPHPGGVVYFGDDIQVIKLAKMGRLLEIAQALKDVLQEGWTSDQFGEAQSYVASYTKDGLFRGDQERYLYMMALNDRNSKMNLVEEHMNTRQKVLAASDRDGIEAFDPEWGWPE